MFEIAAERCGLERSPDDGRRIARSVRLLLWLFFLEPLKRTPGRFRGVLVALPLVDFPQQIIGLGVGGVERRGLLEFLDGLGVLVLPGEKRAQLVVRLRESRVVPERFLQILLRVLQARQLDQERAQVEGGPGRRRPARVVQPNGILIGLDGVIVFSDRKSVV